jgi:hypothetical protein
MSFEKENLKFGCASFVGPVMKDLDFFALPVSEQATAIGWAVGCPITGELTDPNFGRGPEAMLLRYGEIGFWAGQLNRIVKELNPDLYEQIVKSVPRQDDEPIGKFEQESVPVSYLFVIPPTETLVGYSLPRLFIKQIGSKELPVEERQDRLARGLEIVEQSVLSSSSPEELLAITAEATAQADVDPATVLSTILSTGWYGEHNAEHMVRNLKSMLEKFAPKLWALYNGLSEQDKSTLKMI